MATAMPMRYLLTRGVRRLAIKTYMHELKRTMFMPINRIQNLSTLPGRSTTHHRRASRAISPRDTLCRGLCPLLPCWCEIVNSLGGVKASSGYLYV